jgi:hypothetical protein
VTSPATDATGAPDFPEYAPVPAIAKGPPLNEHGYHVWQVQRNLYAVTDNVYMSAFLTTRERPRCSAETSSASATRRPGDCCSATTTPPAPSRT